MRCHADGLFAPEGVLGNLGRNTLTGHGFDTIDLVLTKNTYVPSRKTLSPWRGESVYREISYERKGKNLTDSSSHRYKGALR